MSLRIPHVVAALVLVAVFAMAVRVPASPDMWWHLRCGEVQWRTRAVLKEDVFSHTAAGTPWINQSWLPQLGMYALYAWAGFPALALAVAALVTATYALAGLTALDAFPKPGRYSPFWVALVVLWAAIATGPVWVARPHLLTFVFTALWVYLLDRHRQRGSEDRIGVLWGLPPSMLLWANCHGGYIVGFVLLGAQIGGICLDTLWRRRFDRLWQRVRPLLIVALLCALAALVNPQGPRLLIFPLQTLGSYAQQAYIAEWDSPDFHDRNLLPFLALILATWSALALSGRATPGIEWLRLLGFTAMALRSGRYLGLCAVVMVPILVRHGALLTARLRANWGLHSATLTTPQGRGSPFVNWILLALILVAASAKVALSLDAETIAQVHRTHFPAAAAARLRVNGLSPTLFNDYGWGGYLIWELYPDVKVFIDGRADPYGDELIAAYRRAISAHPDWDATLDAYDVQTALIPAASALASVLEESMAWEHAYADDLAAIYVRSSTTQVSDR
jgi:hypothetical protein